MTDLNDDLALDALERSPARGSVISEQAVSLSIPQKKSFRRLLADYPFHVAQLASLPVVAGLMAVTGGASFFHQLRSAIATGNPVGGVAIFAGAVYALMTTSVVSQMMEEMRASDHDRSSNVLTKALRLSVERLSRSLDHVDHNMDDISYRLDQLTNEMAHLRSGHRRTRKNRPEVWANLAPGCTLYIVNGQCRFDVESELQPNRTTKLIPNYDRLLNWVRRYGNTGVNRANIVLYVDDLSEEKPAVVPPQVAYIITAFRATRKLACAYRAELHLDRAHFYLQSKSITHHMKSFVVGEYSFGGDANIPFVNSYCDHAAMYNVPRTLLDDDVDTYYGPDAVSNYRHLAEALIAGLPSHSLDDLERRYGHLVPDPDLDPTFVARNPGAVDTTENEDEIVEHGDGHFVIRRRPKRN